MHWLLRCTWRGVGKHAHCTLDSGRAVIVLRGGSSNRPANSYHCGVAVGVIQERSGAIVGAHANGDAAAPVVLIVIDFCTILDVGLDLIPAPSNPGQVSHVAQEAFLILSLDTLTSALRGLAQTLFDAAGQTMK